VLRPRADSDRLHRAFPAATHGACAAAFATLAAVSAFSTPAAASDPPYYKADIGASVGYLHRSVKNNTSVNPLGASYDAAFAQTAHLAIPVFPWVRIGVFFQHAYHGVNIPEGSLEPAGAGIDKGSMRAYTLGARIQPTLAVSRRLSLHLFLGAAWGRLTMPPMKVSSSSRSYELPERTGVFVEVPVGFGAAFEIIPHWLTITFDSTVAPNMAQGGSLFGRTQFVDSTGALDHTQPMPQLNLTWAQMFGLSVLL
jgi:hypothetical protein